MTKKFISVGATAIALLGASLPAIAQTANTATDNFSNPYPLQDVFDTQPPRATAEPGSACATAEIYVNMVSNQKWGEIGSLFAEDGVFLTPRGEALRGRERITAWFAAGQSVAVAQPLSFTSAGRECFMEIAGKRKGQADDKFRIVAIDHFTVNDKGQFTRAVYYFRPQTLGMADKVP